MKIIYVKKKSYDIKDFRAEKNLQNRLLVTKIGNNHLWLRNKKKNSCGHRLRFRDDIHAKYPNFKVILEATL